MHAKSTSAGIGTHTNPAPNFTATLLHSYEREVVLEARTIHVSSVINVKSNSAVVTIIYVWEHVGEEK